MAAAVPKRIASGIINALKGGVVPRTGLGYIAVGRTAEINALLHDVDITEEGGAFSASSSEDTEAERASCFRPCASTLWTEGSSPPTPTSPRSAA